jgi:uncharacterized membrane protein YbaN (DUF454 family)
MLVCVTSYNRQKGSPGLCKQGVRGSSQLSSITPNSKGLSQMNIRLKGVLNRFKRFLFVTFGLMFLGLGIVGYVLPGMPGTIFLIIAAALFVRSSDRLYNFVVKNRLFGRHVKDFLETGAMPLKAKIISVVSIWIFSLISIFLAPYTWLFKGPVLILAIVGTIYIISRPTRRNSV